MWKPHLDFITIHYLYIVCLGILTFTILYPDGNISSADAYFFGVSGSTESGLNVVDLNDLRSYQQIALYLIPIMGNMQVVSIFIVALRLFWFRKRLKARADRVALFQKAATDPIRPSIDMTAVDEANTETYRGLNSPAGVTKLRTQDPKRTLSDPPDMSYFDVYTASDTEAQNQHTSDFAETSLPTATATPGNEKPQSEIPSSAPIPATPGRITFGPDPTPLRSASTSQPLSSDESSYFPDEKRGCEHDPELPNFGLSQTVSNEGYEASMSLRKRRTNPPRSAIGRRGVSSDGFSLNRVISNVFELGGGDIHGHLPTRAGTLPPPRRTTQESNQSYTSRRDQRRQSRVERLKLSANAMMGRNSNFSNLTSEDKDRLGGIEYQALKLLLKLIIGYYVSLHLIGILCLTPWIHLTREPKYRDYLASKGIDQVWWSIYSAGTMANNLGFTLTPDSMISFRDAIFPILIMTLIAYAGHTFFPVCLRLLIWTFSKLLPAHHKLQDPLHFLLDHPRRCYTLLFPSRQTWILAGILIALNIVDVILIICLDLDNPEVTIVPLAPRFISSIFQAASSRHTGTSTFNLANVSPGVQFSLLVMMYVSIFPIAISVRSSNTYEESSLGVFQDEEADPDQATTGRSYLKAHVRNQLSFDLWYIFLGCFCICCSEAERIMDQNDYAFQVFPVFFEVASAYGNVGLSLGHPSVSTSFSGKFNTFSKLVICAMMIRGRHRGLPVKLDRAIMLPSDRFALKDEEDALDGEEKRWARKRLPKLKMAHTE